MHYLSAVPEALTEVLITGIPAAGATDRRHLPRDVSARDRQNRCYYERYPGRCSRARIVQYLNGHDVAMPSGGRPTPERFLQLGIAFGASDGYEQVHYLIEEAFVNDGWQSARSIHNFLVGIEHAQAFDTN